MPGSLAPRTRPSTHQLIFRRYPSRLSCCPIFRHSQHRKPANHVASETGYTKHISTPDLWLRRLDPCFIDASSTTRPIVGNIRTPEQKTFHKSPWSVLNSAHPQLEADKLKSAPSLHGKRMYSQVRMHTYTPIDTRA
ncbi:unnamed protein product [Protopolystoma xenopodis]|uniref:Uncharacterized protein n=1 Tax=Protopolystoma xenopodis TaxID=117903 RepID=A0A448WF68_9PLAT|nr:unnamed protein product [Protopolystoma xenopodis]